ncbi:hypothetical protein Q9966_001824 [Columba livia]|nr:hypothetical protein Q9966_001824 [Columba livia]
MLNSDLSQVSVKAGSSRLFPSQKTWMQVWNRDPAEQMANRGCQALCCFIWLQRVMNSPNTSYSGFVEETHGDCDKEGSKDLGSWVTGSRLRQPGEASTAAPQSSVLVMTRLDFPVFWTSKILEKRLYKLERHLARYELGFSFPRTKEICEIGGGILSMTSQSWQQTTSPEPDHPSAVVYMVPYRILEKTTDWYIYIIGCDETLTPPLSPISGMLPTLAFCISVSPSVPRNSKGAEVGEDESTGVYV